MDRQMQMLRALDNHITVKTEGKIRIDCHKEIAHLSP
jgi:nitrate/TMAO reductase-like tetraheme cytochrome c subunit